MESILKNKDYIDQKKSEMDIFDESFKKSKSWIKSENVPAFMNHIFGTGLFLFFYAFDKKQSKDFKILDEDTIKNTIDKIYDITVNGFLNKKENIEIDFKSIEDSCVVTKDDLPQKDKIFDAITSVVAKVGVWNASLDMIAKEVCMSKSSFYFYFANKEEMLGNIVMKEIEKTNDIYIQKSDNYKNFFEKIYSNIVIEATYMSSDIRIMYFFNWLHYQKINFKVNKKISRKAEEIFTERFNFIREAIQNNVLKSYDFGFMEIASFTKMQIVKEILISTIFERTINEENFRNIYKLFLVGIYE
ncbi:MAG TPA: TetR/AcrR family transcriptional regulator [Spirochaetota bacterium]|nr:TetR/AcrR family transcriptional regulator [Spirochaetota bacterium]